MATDFVDTLHDTVTKKRIPVTAGNATRVIPTEAYFGMLLQLKGDGLEFKVVVEGVTAQTQGEKVAESDWVELRTFTKGGIYEVYPLPAQTRVRVLSGRMTVCQAELIKQSSQFQSGLTSEMKMWNENLATAKAVQVFENLNNANKIVEDVKERTDGALNAVEVALAINRDTLDDVRQTTEEMRSVAGTYTLGRKPQVGDPDGTYRWAGPDGPVDISWSNNTETGRTPALLTPLMLVKEAGFDKPNSTPLPQLQTRIIVDARQYGIKGDGSDTSERFAAMNAEIEQESRIVNDLAGFDVMLPPGSIGLKNRVKPTTSIIYKGQGGRSTRLFPLSDDLTMFEFEGINGGGLENLMLDGGMRTGVRGVWSHNECAGQSYEGVTFESLPTAFQSEYTYYAQFSRCLFMSYRNGLLLDSASNGYNILGGRFNTGMAGAQSIQAFNSANLNLHNVGFEGVVKLDFWQFEGLAIIGGYYEDDEERNVYFINLGNAGGPPEVGLPVRGAKVSGVKLNHGAKTAIRLTNVEGVSIDGNEINTGESAYELYGYDNAYKRSVHIGANAYNVGLRELPADPNRAWHPEARATTRWGYDPGKLFKIVGGDDGTNKTRLVDSAPLPVERIFNSGPSDNDVFPRTAVEYTSADSYAARIVKLPNGTVRRYVNKTVEITPAAPQASKYNPGEIVESDTAGRGKPILWRRNVDETWSTLRVPIEFSAADAGTTVAASAVYRMEFGVQGARPGDFVTVAAPGDMGALILGQAYVVSDNRVILPIYNPTAVAIALPASTGRWRVAVLPADNQY